jgi:hypothetical protein
MHMNKITSAILALVLCGSASVLSAATVTTSYAGKVTRTERDGNASTVETVVWWYKFTTAVANTRVRFDMLSEAGTIDLNGNGTAQPFNSVIRLFNAAGTQLASNDTQGALGSDGNGSRTRNDAFINYRNFAAAGTYLLAIGATYTRPNPAPRTSTMSVAQARQGWQPFPVGTNNTTLNAPFRLDVSVNRGSIASAAFGPAVPEPTTWAMLIVAAAGGAVLWRRRLQLA